MPQVMKSLVASLMFYCTVWSPHVSPQECSTLLSQSRTDRCSPSRCPLHYIQELCQPLLPHRSSGTRTSRIALVSKPIRSILRAPCPTPSRHLRHVYQRVSLPQEKLLCPLIHVRVCLVFGYEHGRFDLSAFCTRVRGTGGRCWCKTRQHLRAQLVSSLIQGSSPPHRHLLVGGVLEKTIRFVKH